MERAGNRALRRRGAAIAASLLLLASACSRAEPSFGALLARIDATAQPAGQEVFERAAALASGTEERLRLLKRAAARETPVYEATARAIARASGPMTEPVALAVLDAYLESGSLAEALALFDGPLDQDDRLPEYLETLVLALRSGIHATPSVERLVACADLTGDHRFLVLGAVEAMVAGDRAVARVLLDDAFRIGAFSGDPGVGVGNGYSRGTLAISGAGATYRLLWDAGALEALCAASPDPFDPLHIAICADAEYLRGQLAIASAYYAQLVERYPSWSWKPYAALARIASSEEEPPRLSWPHSAPPGSYAEASRPSAVAAALYDGMSRSFPDSIEAELERARWLWNRGEAERAAAVAGGLRGEAAAIAAMEYGEPERRVPGALRLAAEYPDSAAAVDAALAALAMSGAWDRFSQVVRKAEASGLETGRAWFWRALELALDGHPSAAAEAVRSYAPAAAGYTGAYDIGILELAARRPAVAADAFLLAAGLASDRDRDASAKKAAALIMAGDSLKAARRLDEAASAYQAALGADPASRDARSRLERLGTRP